MEAPNFPTPSTSKRKPAAQPIPAPKTGPSINEKNSTPTKSMGGVQRGKTKPSVSCVKKRTRIQKKAKHLRLVNRDDLFDAI